jgi:hypothetical protein
MRLVAVLLLVLGLSACAADGGTQPLTISVPTQEPRPPGELACPAALAFGTLVLDPRWGIALRADDGTVTKVVWPHGYFGRQTDAAVELVDGDGSVVAIVGTHVEMGGGFGADDAWYPCG